MKYEYIELSANSNSTVNLIDKINEKGEEGYRLVDYSYLDCGVEVALMEKEIPDAL